MAIRIVDDTPYPHPISATLAPPCFSFSSTPFSEGIHEFTRFPIYLGLKNLSVHSKRRSWMLICNSVKVSIIGFSGE
ncbi:MAG TPA: hypothetical protein VFV86_13285 [Nitrososphaeraceae archaeon]|nr:hypothetical protein [Nitrososphaeraceae archaeon]